MQAGFKDLMTASLIYKLRFDNIANNMANINTSGYKKSVLSFHQALDAAAVSKIDFNTGPIVHTGNNLDVALNGFGFFKVRTARGVRYTRDGAFSLDPGGTLTTRTGEAVLGDNGPIVVRGKQVSITEDGEVTVDGRSVGRLQVVSLEEREMLRREGGSLYRYEGTAGGEKPAENVQIKQTYLEKSNVGATEEMVRMLKTFRGFESVQKAIQSLDEVTRKLINEAAMLR